MEANLDHEDRPDGEVGGDDTVGSVHLGQLPPGLQVGFGEAGGAGHYVDAVAESKGIFSRAAAAMVKSTITAASASSHGIAVCRYLQGQFQFGYKATSGAGRLPPDRTRRPGPTLRERHRTADFPAHSSGSTGHRYLHIRETSLFRLRTGGAGNFFPRRGPGWSPRTCPRRRGYGLVPRPCPW